ncbi:MAG: HD domain-containing protein [Parcubacteria group bacterium]|nr:HD domain-containing protein [Parcubacteria group bacterium]
MKEVFNLKKMNNKYRGKVVSKCFNRMYLEQRVQRVAKQTRIKPKAWNEFETYLADLKKHNARMYLHCLRVGIYAHGLAKYEKTLDVKFPFFGGCGHDYGKCDISNILLDSKHLTKQGYTEIRAHSVIGFRKLKKHFLFTAFIAGLHHKYQQHGYGIDIKKSSPFHLRKKSIQKIEKTARLVMICDFFDALTTRKNNKGFIKNTDDKKEQRAVMQKYFPDSALRINWLIKQRIK